MASPTESLLQRTLRLLREDRRSIAQLHKDTGLEYHWLRKVRSGEIRNPGVERIEQLHNALSAHA